MCWACYTPLSGGAVAAGGVPAAGTIGVTEERTKKTPIPMWQIGVLGLAGVGGLIFLAMSLMGGSSSTEPPVYGTDTTSTTISTSTRVTNPSFSTSSTSPSVSSGPAAAPVTPAAPVTQTGQLRFTLSTSPQRGIPWGTMAIVPTDSAAAQDAAGLAATASQQMAKTGRWDGLYVYVFQDASTAQKFRTYQKDHDGQPLGEADYESLKDLWPNTLLCYQNSRGDEALRYPSKNPDGWWNDAPKITRAHS